MEPLADRTTQDLARAAAEGPLRRDLGRLEEEVARLRRLVAGFFLNAHRLRVAGDSRGRQALISITMEAFGIGSTLAHALCREFDGGDPYREVGDPADACEHGIPDGEYCPECNAAYRQARAENGPEGGEP